MKNLFSQILKSAICLAAWFLTISIAFNVTLPFSFVDPTWTQIDHLGVRIGLSVLLFLVSSGITYARITRRW